MIRSTADRAFLPANNLFEQVGDMMILTARRSSTAVRPPIPSGDEFMPQILFALGCAGFCV